MNNGLKSVFIFASGMFVGSLITWKFIRSKYEIVYDYDFKEDENEEESESDDSITYAELIKNEEKKDILDYTSYANTYTSEGREEDEDEDEDDVYEETEVIEPEKKSAISKPFVISPDEFGEDPNYDQVYLTYYSGDGYLAYDEDNSLIEHAEDIIAWESLEHIGEYEDNIVHVQNDDLKCYFEISVDERRYRDVVDNY